jgi:hypothetical protein
VQLGARLLAGLEAQRLEQKRGTDDPRVQILHDRSEAILARVNALCVEREIANMRMPAAVKTGALVQGRITDTQRRAAGRVTVRLVKEKGEEVAGVDPVEVDDAGYYIFVLKPETVAAVGTDTKLLVALRDGQEQLVAAAAKPFTIAPGVSALQEVTLSDAELERLRLRVPAAHAPMSEPPPTPRKAPEPPHAPERPAPEMPMAEKSATEKQTPMKPPAPEPPRTPRKRGGRRQRDSGNPKVQKASKGDQKK